jgi:hypothetical protein
MIRLFALLAFMAAFASAQNAPVMDAVRLQYGNAKRNLIEAARLMPEEHYGFKLTPPQRSYSDWIEHTAGLNLRLCSLSQGAAPPAAPKTNGSKAELVAALETAFAFCDAVITGMTDEHAMRVVNERPRRTSIDYLLGLIANLNSHYGNMVGYLRTKGIVPPSTARAQPMKH